MFDGDIMNLPIQDETIRREDTVPGEQCELYKQHSTPANHLKHRLWNQNVALKEKSNNY